MIVPEITIDTAVVGGTGALVIFAFSQAFARTKAVDRERNRVARMAMQLASELQERALAEAAHWRAIAEAARTEADDLRRRLEENHDRPVPDRPRC